MTDPLILDVVPAERFVHYGPMNAGDESNEVGPPQEWKRPCPDCTPCPTCGKPEVNWQPIHSLCEGTGTITTPLPSVINWEGQRVSVEAVQIVAKPSDANGRAAMTTPVRADSGEFVAFWMPNGSINPAKGGMLLTLPDAAEQGMYAIVGREAPE
jgi:hypothetical protein